MNNNQKAVQEFADLLTSLNLQITPEQTRFIHAGLAKLIQEVGKDGWISVEDRLPPYLTRCLVTNGEYIKLSWSKDEDEAWCEIQDSDTDVWLNDVTHWMPLPQPPKQ